MTEPWVLVPHALAAGLALPLGAWQLWRSEKGTHAHRLVGRVWVALMLWVSLSSFWIKEIRPGSFSLLHLLSVVTIGTVGAGLVAVLRGHVELHRGMMRGSWFGLLGAFVFATAIPGRTIPTFAVDDPWRFAGTVLALGVTTAAVVALGMRATPART